MTAVCFGRGSCRGQCKDVTPERARAGVRGGTPNECGEGGGRRGGGGTARTKPPCHSHPPLDALMHAVEGREGRPGPGGQEMRDVGGGASPGAQGLEVVSPSSQGPRRMLKGDSEGRPSANSTWRSFAAHSSCSSQACRFPHVPGRWGLQAGGRVGWSVWPGRPGAWRPRTKLLPFPLPCGHLGGYPAADQRKCILLHPKHRHLDCFP